MNDLSSTLAPNAIYRISRQLIHWFERRFAKVFTMNRHGRYVGRDLDYLKILFFLQPREALYEVL